MDKKLGCRKVGIRTKIIQSKDKIQISEYLVQCSFHTMDRLRARALFFSEENGPKCLLSIQFAMVVSQERTGPQMNGWRLVFEQRITIPRLSMKSTSASDSIHKCGFYSLEFFRSDRGNPTQFIFSLGNRGSWQQMRRQVQFPFAGSLLYKSS